MTREVIVDAFRFVTRHGFTEAAPDSHSAFQVAVRFVRSRATIDASYNDRDGFDCTVTLEIHAAASVSLGTLIAALKVDELTRAGSPSDSLEEQVRWLKRHIEKVLEAPPTVIDDCRALRFYHAGAWRQKWGTAIVMDAKTRDAEQHRVDRLRRYFEPLEQVS